MARDGVAARPTPVAVAKIGRHGSAAQPVGENEAQRYLEPRLALPGSAGRGTRAGSAVHRQARSSRSGLEPPIKLVLVEAHVATQTMVGDRAGAGVSQQPFGRHIKQLAGLRGIEERLHGCWTRFDPARARRGQRDERLILLSGRRLGKVLQRLLRGPRNRAFSRQISWPGQGRESVKKAPRLRRQRGGGGLARLGRGRRLGRRMGSCSDARRIQP